MNINSKPGLVNPRLDSWGNMGRGRNGYVVALSIPIAYGFLSLKINLGNVSTEGLFSEEKQDDNYFKAF